MSERPGRGPVWFRSLYWRIAIGLGALLAGLLLVQALVFLWLTGTIATTLMGQSPDRIAADAAKEVAAALQKDPGLDIEKLVRDRYGSQAQPLMIVMEDGRVVRNHELPAPEGMRRRPGRLADGAPPDPGGGRVGGMRPWGSRMGPGRDGPPGERASIDVGGTQVGFVVVAGRGPRPAMFLREFAPAQAVIGVVLLIVGSAVASLSIFRPARRRLRGLEKVAQAIGEGDASARAVETGGDEVTALARAFNRMAGDLEARTRAMELSDRTRRQLLADVSHELKTPLAAIRGYVETLAMPEVRLDDETRRRYLDIVGDETIKLERIVGDLLDLARLESGGLTLTCEAVPVARLYQRLADRHERELIEKQVALETSIAPGVSDVWGDPARLEQALQNLVANALRHTPDGGRITLVAEPSGEKVRLVLRDSGGGIPEEHLPRIFDRFYKADASRTDPYSKTGSGLGLSIVKAIIERHGGTVSAANIPAGGAEFAITLPRGRGVRLDSDPS